MSIRPVQRWTAVGSVLLAAATAMVAIGHAQCPSDYGDLNADGELNVLDVQCSLRVTLSGLVGAELPVCLAGGPAKADVTADELSTVEDIVVLIALALGDALPEAVDANGNNCWDEYETLICGPFGCGGPGTCTVDGTIGCGDTIIDSTSGGSSVLSGYACDASNADGPERVYAFSAPVGSNVDIWLDSVASAAVELRALSGFCAPDACSSSASNEAHLLGVTGETFFFTVDSPPGGDGSFALSVTCSSGCPEEAACADVECGDTLCGGGTVDCGSCPIGWECTEGHCEPENPWPACPGAGSCLNPNGTPGCSDPGCCITICSIDPKCCRLGWDAVCAQLAALAPACL